MTPDELMRKINKDAENKVDLEPLTTELVYQTTDAVDTYDILLWNSPTGRRYLKFKKTSRSKFIKGLDGNDRYICDICDEPMRSVNMEYLLGRFSNNNEKMLVRCRDITHDHPDLTEELEVRGVFKTSHVKFDNPEFLKAMLQPMIDHNMELGNPDLTDDHLMVRGYFAEDTSIIEGKNLFRPGLMIVNSETGKYKPAVECIMENTTFPGLIRWPVDAGPLLEVDRKNIHAADLSKIAAQVPSTAYEQIEKMDQRVRKLAKEKYNADYTLQLYLMMRSARINDDGSKLQEMNRNLATATGNGARAVTKLDMVVAVARVAHQHSSMRFAHLAGNMLTQDAIWSNQLALLTGKDKTDKTEPAEEVGASA